MWTRSIGSSSAVELGLVHIGDEQGFGRLPHRGGEGVALVDPFGDLPLQPPAEPRVLGGPDVDKGHVEGGDVLHEIEEKLRELLHAHVHLREEGDLEKHGDDRGVALYELRGELKRLIHNESGQSLSAHNAYRSLHRSFPPDDFRSTWDNSLHAIPVVFELPAGPFQIRQPPNTEPFELFEYLPPREFHPHPLPWKTSNKFANMVP